MKRFVLVSVFFLLGHVMLHAQNKEEKQLIVKEIQSKDKKLESFVLQNLADSIAQLFTPNCHLMPEFGEIIEGRDEVDKYLTSSMKSGVKISSFKLNPLELKVYGDLVLEIGTFEMKYTASSGATESKARYNYQITWKTSKKGNYRIRFATWNSPKAPR